MLEVTSKINIYFRNDFNSNGVRGGRMSPLADNYTRNLVAPKKRTNHKTFMLKCFYETTQPAIVDK